MLDLIAPVSARPFEIHQDLFRTDRKHFSRHPLCKWRSVQHQNLPIRNRNISSTTSILATSWNLWNQGSKNYKNQQHRDLFLLSMQQTWGEMEGWTLLLKGVGGAPGDLWSLWSSPNTANTRVPAAQQLTSAYVGHYKPQIANDLDTCDFDRIKVAVYNNGMEKAHVTFDGRNTGRDSWFDKRRIIESTFTDINSQQQFLQMAGDPATGHEFFIGQPVSGCTGSGWIMVSTRNTCTSEAGTNPGFYYSSTGTASNFNSGNMQSADVFAIMGQGGSCGHGATNPPSITASSACVYKNNVYKQGQWWQDGCQYNCTCEDASRGFYRCTDLCLTYPTLPPLCNLVKPDGECCAKPMGPGCPGPTGACVYKTQIYQQGQKWNDGCDYTCECVDGGTGRYQCTSMCLDFNLPAACHYDPAPAGKCCKLPVCPSYIQIQYPPGYVPR